MRLVGTIVSSFLACVLLVLGGVHNGRLALKKRSNRSPRRPGLRLRLPCNKKAEANNLGYKFLWWALPGLNR